MRLSERIADTIDDTDTALWIADEIWAMEDEIDELRDKLDTIYATGPRARNCGISSTVGR